MPVASIPHVVLCDCVWCVWMCVRMDWTGLALLGLAWIGFGAAFSGLFSGHFLFVTDESNQFMTRWQAERETYKHSTTRQIPPVRHLPTVIFAVLSIVMVAVMPAVNLIWLATTQQGLSFAQLSCNAPWLTYIIIGALLGIGITLLLCYVFSSATPPKQSLKLALVILCIAAFAWGIVMFVAVDTDDICGTAVSSAAAAELVRGAALWCSIVMFLLSLFPLSLPAAVYSVMCFVVVPLWSIPMRYFVLGKPLESE